MTGAELDSIEEWIVLVGTGTVGDIPAVLAAVMVRKLCDEIRALQATVAALDEARSLR